jgi:putative aldouronate transport system permease protein
MLLPVVGLLLLFSYYPMIGLIISFQNYIPTKGFFGSQWIGLDNYKYLLSLPDVFSVLRNTVVISLLKIITGLVSSLVFALLLNEIANRYFKRVVQTVVFFPYFLSWVILSGILIDILSTKGGAINQLLGLFGASPIFFLGDSEAFIYVLVITNIWKDFGFAMIIFLAAMTNIDPGLFDAARIDGAGHLRQVTSIILPSISPMIILMATLSLGSILNAGFDQVFNLYNILVYDTGDIIDTYVFRIGIVSGQYSIATAVGLLKSVVGLTLISLSYWAANRFANYRII